MTSEDILNGFMKVTIQVAMVRPAEFIVISFQQQMATSKQPQELRHNRI